MTRKRVGQGLLEAFSETCEVCKGRGVIIHTEPVPDKRGGDRAAVAKVAAAIPPGVGSAGSAAAPAAMPGALAGVGSAGSAAAPAAMPGAPAGVGSAGSAAAPAMVPAQEEEEQ